MDVDFEKYTERIGEKCLSDKDGQKCSNLGFNYSKIAYLNDKDVIDTLNCIKDENYKKGCFLFGEILGENKYLFEK